MLIDALLLVVATPLLLIGAYLLLLTLLSGRPQPPPSADPRTRFLLVVPAHDEAGGIGRTVKSLLALEWPAEARRVHVIADNCSDDTAAIARAAGAEVTERSHASLRGKGYALQVAYDQAIAEGWCDAVVVVDADTDVDPGLLRAFAGRIQLGAQAVQAFYGVRNPRASWRTRLVTLALAIFHRLRGRGRERLRVSCGLRGNGMCFALDTLRRVPHNAFSRVEDLEYGVALGRAGIRVWYADEAEVRADMVASEKASRSQRQRWEGGRFEFARAQGGPLLRDAVRGRSALLLDLAADVLTPPLGYFGLGAILLALGAVLLWVLGVVMPVTALLSGLPLAVLVVHVARGVSLSGLGARGWLDLAAAPVYVLWKLSLVLRRRASSKAWVRTERDE
ncbi:cellulose synthase/poly-beta-1,6-N-acetylglucosamine synthase-like glycosyltransferase [Panacagrimonas perspica]|uniref:Cellulose synthase/poly-beta-1,6-N-acetylglucosamine synthase-like glycosyltransferase n=1 Tax=Panacagrimonas perspica TaxID=381431 RepID=A0A4R7P4S6_9GAMM|nr:glycosyltransferase [Panacagrimonas perspica]TDU28697.1 cellulose synthase/poly-beta-1,6-N-acetylglucosamine synthase-like glycosyltransferase [Panacagrimonas perspica]